MNELSETQFTTLHVSFDELCNSANMSAEYILELVDYDIIEPIVGTQPQEWQFNVSAMIVVNKAARLHRDLEINWADMALVLNLLEEIDTLKNENKSLKQQLNRFLM